jgi:2-dehydro-3-deoxygluconokinase
VRAPASCSARGHTAISQLRPGDIDWDRIFGELGSLWFHCGGIFAALSDSTAEVAREAMACAHRYGMVVSYDLNYRESLWEANGGAKRAAEVNQSLLDEVDVLLGVGGNGCCALGYDFATAEDTSGERELENYEALLMGILKRHPRLKIAATTTRRVRSATTHDWGGVAATPTGFVAGPRLDALEVLDRVGGGDAFAAGFIYALVNHAPVDRALAYGVAHGALAMTTPGDTSMATRADVENLVRGGDARVTR